MKILKPLIDQLVKVVKEGYDLGKKELPIVAKELLAYSFWYAVAELTVVVAAIIALSWLAIWMGQEAAAPLGRYDRDGHGEYWFGVFLLIGANIGLAIQALDTTNRLLKIKLAPRVFVLETLKAYID